MIKNEVARPKVILDGKQAEEELDKLTAKAVKYRNAMIAAASAGDSKREKEMARNLKQTTTEINNMKKEAFSVEKVLKNINGASFNEISQATRKATADLKKMKQTDPGYADQKKAVSELKAKLRELNKESGTSISSWEKFKSTASGLLPAFGFAAIAAGAKIAFDSIIGSTDVLSTKWAVFTGGLKSGMNEFWRSIGAGDWSNFLTNFKEAVRVGREYETMLDNIEEKNRALRIKEAESRKTELDLEIKLKNQTLSKAERLEAGQQRIQLEEDLSKERVKVAQDAFDAELKVTMQQTRLSKERLMEVVSDMDSETKIKAQAYNEQLSIYESALLKEQQAKAGLSRAGISVNPFSKEVSTTKAILDSYPDSVRVYAEAIRGVGKTTDEQLDKMVSGYENLLTAQNSSVENIKKVRTQVNSLLAGGDEEGQKSTTNATKEDLDNTIKSLDIGYKQQLLFLKQKYEGEETLQKEYKARMLANEIAYLAAKEQITIDEETRLDLQSQIISKQVEYASALKETVPELLNTNDGVEKLNTRLLEEAKLLDLVAQKQSEAAAATDELKAKTEMQRNVILQSADALGQSLYTLASGGEDALKEAGKNLIMFALDMLKVQTEIAIAGATIQSLAQPDSILTFGVSGLIRAAIIVGLIEAAFAGVKGLVNSAFSTKKGEKTSGYAEGGFTDGDRIYRAGEKGPEWIAPNSFLRNPYTASIIAGLEQMRKNPADINNMIDITEVPGFASGGFTQDALQLKGGAWRPGWFGSPFSMADNGQNALLLKISQLLDANTTQNQQKETGKSIDITNLSKQNGYLSTANMASINKAVNSISFGFNSTGYSRPPDRQAKSKQDLTVTQVADPELKRLLAENSSAIKELMSWKPYVSIELIEKQRKIWNDIVDNRGL